MRERLFQKGMSFLERHPSRLFARLQLQILLSATAKAFEKKGRCILFTRDPLKAYGVFTKHCMRKPADRKRLYQVSLRLGRRIRKITGFRNPDDLQRLVFLLYRNIGITMLGDLPGEVIITGCFFSRIYSANQCSCISAMDHGIIAGICGDGGLTFTQRITEGCGYCKARFELWEGR